MADDERSIDPAFASAAGALVGLAGTIEAALDHVGLTLWQYRILAFVALQPATPSDVAQWRSVKKQAVSRHLNSLVEQGLLTRTPAPADRRHMIHTATPKGREKLHEAADLMELYLDGLLATMPPARAATVRRGLEEAGAALDEIWKGRAPVPATPSKPSS